MYMYIYRRYAKLYPYHSIRLHHFITCTSPNYRNCSCKIPSYVRARSLTVPERVAFSLERDHPSELGIGLAPMLSRAYRFPKRGAMARPIIR